MIYDWFNLDYAWEKLSSFFSSIDTTDTSQLIQLIIVILLAIIVWKFIKNILISIIFTILCFIVYQTYLNVPQNSQTINNGDTHVDIKTNSKNNLSSDIKKVIDDLINKDKEK